MYLIIEFPKNEAKLTELKRERDQTQDKVEDLDSSYRNSLNKQTKKSIRI